MTRFDSDRELGESLRALRQNGGIPGPAGDEPADEALLRYLEGTATRRERREVEERLGRSQYGRDVAGILTGALAEVGEPLAAKQPASDLMRIVLVVTRDALQFLRGDLVPVAVAGPAAVRGTAAAAPTYCEFATSMGELGVALALDRAAERVDARMVLTSGGAPVQDARVSLCREGRALVSVPSEQDGSLSFAVPSGGFYVVEVRRRGQLVGRFALDFIAQA